MIVVLVGVRPEAEPPPHLALEAKTAKF